MGEAKRRQEAMMNGAKTCGNCEFFTRDAIGRSLGTCRGDVPQVMVIGGRTNPVLQVPEVMTDSFWPKVPDVSPPCRRHEFRLGAVAAIPPIDLSKLEIEETEGTA